MKNFNDYLEMITEMKGKSITPGLKIEGKPISKMFPSLSEAFKTLLGSEKNYRSAATVVINNIIDPQTDRDKFFLEISAEMKARKKGGIFNIEFGHYEQKIQKLLKKSGLNEGKWIVVLEKLVSQKENKQEIWNDIKGWHD